MSEKQRERLRESVLRWRRWGMARGEIVESLLRNDPPLGATPTREQAEALADDA